MFIPKSESTRRMKQTETWCQWCGEFGKKKSFFKVRDGPVDWFFCNGEHYEEWLTFRTCGQFAALLKATPEDRVSILKGQTIDEYVLKWRYIEQARLCVACNK